MFSLQHENPSQMHYTLSLSGWIITLMGLPTPVLATSKALSVSSRLKLCVMSCFTLAAPDATMDKAIGYLQNKIIQCDCHSGTDLSIAYLLLSRLKGIILVLMIAWGESKTQLTRWHIGRFLGYQLLL